jgi:hypothetical protein
VGETFPRCSGSICRTLVLSRRREEDIPPLGGVVTGPAATESAKLTALEQAPGVVSVWSWSRDCAANPLS